MVLGTNEFLQVLVLQHIILTHLEFEVRLAVSRWLNRSMETLGTAT